MIRHYIKLKYFNYNDAVYTSRKINNIFTNVGITQPELIWPECDDNLNNIVNTIWTKYIYPRYWNSAISYVDNESETFDNEEVIEQCKETLGYILSWFKETYDKYKIIIDSFESVKNKLLDDISTTNITVYNDTPQNVQYPTASNNDYATTVNKSTTSTQITTKMQRLLEIENNIKTYYDKWTNEFESTFIIQQED